MFRTLHPTHCLADMVSKLPSFNIVPHPGVCMFIYRLAFGSGQLSLWHFHRVEGEALRTLNVGGTACVPLVRMVPLMRIARAPREIITHWTSHRLTSPVSIASICILPGCRICSERFLTSCNK